MTQQIAGWLHDHLAALGVGVLVTAEHLCMSLRGALASGTAATSIAVRGALATDAALRAEFIQLAVGR
jgi:GTP cyclohydrolase I